MSGLGPNMIPDRLGRSRKAALADILRRPLECTQVRIGEQPIVPNAARGKGDILLFHETG
jgi:hypothetical protein